MTEITLSNGLTLTLAALGGQFIGIGAVRADSISLRSERSAAFVEIWTPDGVTLTEFQTVRQEISPSCIDVSLTARARTVRQMEWMLHEARPRLNVSELVPSAQPAAKTTLRLVITPVVREIGDRPAVGFTYQYHYHSPGHAIYKMLDRAT